MDNWNDVRIKSVFKDGDISCYKLDGGNLINQYYVVSDPDTSRLMDSPEVVGYNVYNCLLPASRRMMRFFKEQGQISSANVLSILRGALNYPMEESCYCEHIPVHDISFLSSERVFFNNEITGLEIKYSKLAMVPDSTLMIGDIIATGDTLRKCLEYVIAHYRKHGCKLRNIIIFTIGGTNGIKFMEEMTQELRHFWPEFEGFIGVYYGGVFNCYKDRGLTGIQVVDVDFRWADGIISPEYRKTTLDDTDAKFEKCTIYDGGARRYEIADHIEEVSEYWEDMHKRAMLIDIKELTDERLGYKTPIEFDAWIEQNHYQELDREEMKALYQCELDFLQRVRVSGLNIKDLAEKRLLEFHAAMKVYML